MLLLASVAALLIGPVVYLGAAGRPRVLSLLDGFNVTAITGLVLLAIVPRAVADRLWWAPVLALVGYVGPLAAERLLTGGHRTMHRWALALGAVVLALHAVTDGAALITGGALPAAVLLHQVPVGFSLWWLLRRLGRGVVATVFLGMAVATGLGYWSGEAMQHALGGREVELFQAFVGGSLLHVIHHRVETEHLCTEPHALRRGWEVLGGALGLIATAAVAWL